MLLKLRENFNLSFSHFFVLFTEWCLILTDIHACLGCHGHLHMDEVEDASEATEGYAGLLVLFLRYFFRTHPRSVTSVINKYK